MSDKKEMGKNWHAQVRIVRPKRDFMPGDAVEYRLYGIEMLFIGHLNEDAELISVYGGKVKVSDYGTCMPIEFYVPPNFLEEVQRSVWYDGHASDGGQMFQNYHHRMVATRMTYDILIPCKSDTFTPFSLIVGNTGSYNNDLYMAQMEDGSVYRVSKDYIASHFYRITPKSLLSDEEIRAKVLKQNPCLADL